MPQEYHEMAEHYNVAIIPARVRRPKDKPGAEDSVGDISTWIIAALRNEQFSSLAELNQAIREKLERFVDAPFTKKDDTRRQFFLEDKQARLSPLPAAPFETAAWKEATVQFNYHLYLDGMYLSGCLCLFSWMNSRFTTSILHTCFFSGNSLYK